ncbi:hypothetical protein [Lapillicoccus jejuensis]|uniref:Uncharacterized protein n=1 Tax=Lapillicoccus jejuensis TaxID=402171 RepID=A0A542E2V1_9MICO|nr:hypothetical protein [Lapillicoccus jejuensis]TQJ09660.1 hypothetical protein FB458_2773 [Lapillicoccus jejuensis]
MTAVTDITTTHETTARADVHPATSFPQHAEGHRPNLVTLEQLRRSGRGVLMSSTVRRVRCR